MKILLDTHALIWWLMDDRALGQRARSMLADPAHDIILSVVSLWEIVVKVRIGKMAANVEKIASMVAMDGFRTPAIRSPHLTALAGLASYHRDPFDHLLIAQALAEGATLMSDDRRVPLYPGQWLACSDARSGASPA